MNKHKTKSPLTDPIRQAIIDSGLPLLRLSKEADVARASLIRFVRGQTSLHLDVADNLARYFGFVLVVEKAPSKQKKAK